MSKRQGPYLMIEASCQGCEWEHSSAYRIQGDSGHIVSCEHPDGRKRIGDTTWQTPGWCPMLPEAKRRLAVTLSNEIGGVMRETVGDAPAAAPPLPTPPDREALGMAVHEAYEDATDGATGARARWDDLLESTREIDRRIGERLFAMGVEHGRQSGPPPRDGWDPTASERDDLLSRAAGLADRWLNPRLTMLDRMRRLDPATEEYRRARAIGRTWAAASRQLCEAFDLPEPEPRGPGAEHANWLLAEEAGTRPNGQQCDGPIPDIVGLDAGGGV